MAVIVTARCLANRSIRFIQGTLILVLVLRGAAATPGQCDVSRQQVAAAGYPAAAVLDGPSYGSLCGESSCCSPTLEQQMLHSTKQHVDAFLKESTTRLSSLLDVRAKKFDTLFRDMMNNSKREFHDMFQKTYGKIYLQNADVFSDFFDELETYYRKGSVRLSDSLEAFFGVLYERMFTVLNGQYTFTEAYLKCVSEHMIEMKPFGDVPHKLTLQLRRSFVATRTYYKALAQAAEVARKMNAVRVDEGCEREVAKMRFCGACRGRRGEGACSGYCSAVLGVCLADFTAFSQEWDLFLDAMDKVADRLVGPYNIEMVVDPLNIKISEAVMNFQESGTEVSKKIYGLCGKPTLHRRRRRTDAPDADAPDEDNPKFELKNEPKRSKKRKNKKYQEEEQDAGPTLEKLIKEIKTKVRETRQFWAHLPYQYCNNKTISAPPSSSDCWNASTPAAPAPKASPVVEEQVYALQTFTNKLRKAYQGEEVDIVDDSEDDLEPSGSGSGDSAPEVEPPEDPIIPEEVTTPKPTLTRTQGGSGGAASISLNRALAQYLLPIVLVWFGGAISDLL